jgi:hypothetical protein
MDAAKAQGEMPTNSMAQSQRFFINAIIAGFFGCTTQRRFQNPASSYRSCVGAAGSARLNPQRGRIEIAMTSSRGRTRTIRRAVEEGARISPLTVARSMS